MSPTFFYLFIEMVLLGILFVMYYNNRNKLLIPFRKNKNNGKIVNKKPKKKLVKKVIPDEQVF